MAYHFHRCECNAINCAESVTIGMVSTDEGKVREFVAKYPRYGTYSGEGRKPIPWHVQAIEDGEEWVL